MLGRNDEAFEANVDKWAYGVMVTDYKAYKERMMSPKWLRV
jgi:hypothetical protein